MKKLALALVSLSVLALGEDSVVSIRPNMYNCEGDQVSFHYTTTSFTGQPTVNVSFKDQSVKLDPKGTINVEQTRIGKIISVTDSHMMLVDGPQVRYSLVLPLVELGTKDSVEFETMMVRTSLGNPFMRPMPFSGVAEHNTFVNVKCVAQKVWF